MKILHFDDEPMLTGMYGVKMGQYDFDYKVYNIVPSDPEEMINLVLSENPDLIVSDIIRPNMDGFTFLKLMKSDPRTKDYPIFMYTNMGDNDLILKAKALGATDYLINALTTPSQFCEIVKSFLTDRENYKKNIDKLIKGL